MSRWFGSLLIAAGLALTGWTLVVWQWEDPVTSLYTRWEQRQLANDYEALVKQEQSRPPAVARGADSEVAQRSILRAAERFRSDAREGSPLGRIVVPRLGLDMVMVNGTEPATLKKGPGRHLGTSMPGEGKLVYIAGHRTTYSAPFALIDRLERGDRVRLEMPYATFDYTVTRHRIVDDQDLSVLVSGPKEEVALQACHPRFFASQRYIVWARPLRVTPRDSTPFTPSQ